MARIEHEKIDFILKIIRNIEYGSLVITIHDGQITQVDRTEKSRFNNSNNNTVTKSFDNFILYIMNLAGGAYMSRIESCPRNINGKKGDSLMQNAYLNLPDLQFFYWCKEQFSVNRGVYNTIDQCFNEYGINEVIFRRKYILSFLQFVSEACLKAEEQKFIRFGKGGLINQLIKFIKSIEAKS